ncbi:tRNA (pseudouridine-N1)-methyltransferase [Pyrobaculum neutrophilum]|uniref:tRNA (pseudouridine(54)-N(1))-methyltransferase n=1 Tax=Pyrobaculum neutrophilum (strain DSM 2338 / JCM 9278 / NBRC 100436 / V24Sta) TaxID=444157 RepID=B1Y961_PYRNV|nr:tRNA (pseudouridine-N1)-methyltransferase [Pyrobaculum neutrophilum]ACB40290.1 protein of unknown function DUF358 [Pyrobaculum neutrophilum V24Sta]
MSFLIKSDVACPWSIDPHNLVKGRFDVLIDFAVEALRGGAREVYIMLCDGTTYHLVSPHKGRSREIASWLLSTQALKTDLRSVVNSYRRVYYLHERGRDISEVPLEGDALYVFGDHDGLSSEDEAFLAKHAVWISLGPTPYMSWQAAVYVAWRLSKLRLDRDN